MARNRKRRQLTGKRTSSVARSRGRPHDVPFPGAITPDHVAFGQIGVRLHQPDADGGYLVPPRLARALRRAINQKLAPKDKVKQLERDVNDLEEENKRLLDRIDRLEAQIKNARWVLERAP